MHLSEVDGYGLYESLPAGSSNRHPVLATQGEKVRADVLDVRVWAAQLANARAGLELFRVVIPADQNINGVAVGDQHVRLLLQGQYMHSTDGASPYWRAVAEITEELQARAEAAGTVAQD